MQTVGDKHSGLQTASLTHEESEIRQLGTPLKRGKRKDYCEWCITSPFYFDIKPFEWGKWYHFWEGKRCFQAGLQSPRRTAWTSPAGQRWGPCYGLLNHRRSVCMSALSCWTHSKGRVWRGYNDDFTIKFVDNSDDTALGLNGVNDGVLVVLHIHHAHVVLVPPAWQSEGGHNSSCDSRIAADGLICECCMHAAMCVEVCVCMHSRSLVYVNFPGMSVFLARLFSLQQEPSELRGDHWNMKHIVTTRLLFFLKKLLFPLLEDVFGHDWIKSPNRRCNSIFMKCLCSQSVHL